MTIYEKLKIIQTKLKAPKGQYNSFGKYHYRSLEDITEAIKPLLDETGATLTISDEIIQIGDRYYVKATATLYDIGSNENISVTAFARESETKKGMDESQITGATSSYARKYALNGLFAIDDTKDTDTEEYQSTAKKEDTKKQENTKPTGQKITKAQIEDIKELAKLKNIDIEALEQKTGKKIEEYTPHEYAQTMKWLQNK